MAERNEEAQAEEKTTLMDTAPNIEEDVSLSQEDLRDVDNENVMPSQQQEEEMIKKKYHGLLPKKKPPLISKDHERAFFDSADWALGKKGKGPVEALQPKLQPTPHHQVRSRSPCAPADEAEANRGESDELSPSESHNLSPADGNP